MARILVIDDDRQVRGALRAVLEREGHDVVDASCDWEGMARYREKPTDIVITDIFMPEKGGIEMIRNIKKDFPEAKIIAISGGCYVRPETYLKIAGGMGAMYTLAKPIERKALIQAVNALL